MSNTMKLERTNGSVEWQRTCKATQFGSLWVSTSHNFTRLADTSPGAMAARKPLIAATLVVFCLLSLLCASPVLALSVEEVTGLQSFATLFPSLSSIPEVETFSDEGVFLGSSWDESMPNACDAGDGWRLHGIHCSEGQIDEIYMYAPSTSFSSSLLLCF